MQLNVYIYILIKANWGLSLACEKILKDKILQYIFLTPSKGNSI